MTNIPCNLMEIGSLEQVVNGLFFKPIYIHQLSLRNVALFLFAKLTLIITQRLPKLHGIQINTRSILPNLATKAIGPALFKPVHVNNCRDLPSLPGDQRAIVAGQPASKRTTMAEADAVLHCRFCWIKLMRR